MSLYSVCSVKGSPGVTTVSTILALTWGAPALLADLDTTGGDLAIRYRDDEGRPLQTERGLMSLGAAVRRDSAETDLEPHLQTISDGPRVLVGISRPEQVVGLGASWQGIAQTLAYRHDNDVVADCGRLLPNSAVMPVIGASRALLVLARPTMEELFHLRERLGSLQDQLQTRDSNVAVGVALLTDDRDHASAGEVQRLLEVAKLRARVVGTVAFDPKAAYRVRYALDAVPGRSMLVRSISALAEPLRDLANRSYAGTFVG